MARPLKKMNPREIINQVKRIRTRNNKLWMSLTVVAIEAKPRRAKAIIRKIVDNDMMVSKWMARL